jgi:hypothetical protein
MREGTGVHNGLELHTATTQKTAVAGILKPAEVNSSGILASKLPWWHTGHRESVSRWTYSWILKATAASRSTHQQTRRIPRTGRGCGVCSQFGVLLLR